MESDELMEMSSYSKKMRIALVSMGNTHNLAARQLCAIMKKQGFETHMIFLSDIIQNDIIPPSKWEIDNAVELIGDRIKPDLLMISVSCSTFFESACELTSRLREKGISKIAWGGIHAILCPEDCINYADYVCVSEGEIPVPMLLERLEKQESVADIPGFWIKENGKIFQNKPSGVVMDLDTLPFPDYENENKYFICQNEYHEKEPFLVRVHSIFVITSRGCPFHCAYCAAPYFMTEQVTGVPHMKIRQRSVGNVIEELKYIRSKIPTFEHITINFADDVFVMKKDWVIEFVEAYKKEFKNPFWCYFHPTLVKDDIVKLFKGVGMRYINMGVQSGSERIRTEVYHRTDTNEKIRTAMDIIHANKIGIMIDVIVDNPFDTQEDRDSALDFFLKLPRPYTLNFLSLIFFPKVEITTRALNEGVISPDLVEMIAKKAFYQMNFHFDWKGRKPVESLYTALYQMCSKTFVPRWFIRMLSKSANLRKNPSFAIRLALFFNFLLFIWNRTKIVLRRLFSGELKFSDFSHSIRKYREAGIPIE
jgi:anaerobic magnesium-protoporphyrin IX monomethyl ester cyclase